MNSKLELKETNHNGECKDTNYHVDGLRNFGQEVFESWNEFKEAYQVDNSFVGSMNGHLCFRYDIKEEMNEEDEATGSYNIHLYIMEQPRGKYIPVLVKRIRNEDMTEINEYLSLCWRYMSGLWSEFSGVEAMYPLSKEAQS